MDAFIGKWQVDTMENIDKQIEIIGADWPEERKTMFREMKIVSRYERDGDGWLLEVSKPDGVVLQTVRFKLGETFDTKSMDDREIKCCINFKDGKFVETHTDTADPTRSADITKEIIDDQLLIKFTVRGITSTLKCKRI